MKILASGFGFPEGPVVMPDGAVILTEIRNGRCSRVTPDGKTSVFSECGGGPNGLAIGPDGALYLCNNGGARYVEGTSMSQGAHAGYKGGSVQRLDARTGEFKTLYAECDGHRLSAPNDLVFDEQGGFYFTDLGKRHARHRDHGGVYYALPDGSKITCIAYPIAEPQRLRAVARRQDPLRRRHRGRLAVGVRHRGAGRAEEAQRHSHHSGRVIGGRHGALRQPGGAGERQIAWHAHHRQDHRVPSGAVVRVKMPDVYPTNICFGGTDRRTAYITLSDTGRLASLPGPEPG